MATEKLTSEEKEINSILMANGYRTYTKQDYSSNEEAVALKGLYLCRDNMFYKENFMLFIYSKLNHRKKDSSPINIDNEIELLAVKHLFGLKEESLAQQIMHQAYAEAISQDEDGSIHFGYTYGNKIVYWIKKCKELDVFFKQYRHDKQDWQGNNHQDYTQKWERLATSPLFIKNTPMPRRYLAFLKKNYRLNQQVKAKADVLLSLKFPNISTLKTAKRIVNLSTLLH